MLPGEIGDFGKSTYVTGLSFSIVGIIAASLGIVSALYRKNRAPVVVHGICITIMWVVFFAQGIALSVLPSGEKDALDSYCVMRSRDAYSSGTLLKSNALEADLVLNEIVSENMCRQDVCPCSDQYQEPYLTLTEETLQLYKRTNDQEDLNDDDGTILMYFPTEDVIPANQTFTTFKDCIADLTTPGNVIYDIGVRNEIEQFTNRVYARRLLEYLE